MSFKTGEVVEWRGSFTFKAFFKTWRAALEWIEKQGKVTHVHKETDIIDITEGLSRVRARRYTVDKKDTFLIIERTKYGKSNQVRQ